MGDVDDRMNAHGVGKAEPDGIGPNQLCDGIGAKPALREFPGGSRKTEIVS